MYQTIAVLTQMGHGQTGVAAKAMNLIHKVALDVGFNKTKIKTWFEDVRVCVTDLGGEWSVADVPDYIDDYLSRGGAKPMLFFHGMTALPLVGTSWQMPFVMLDGRTPMIGFSARHCTHYPFGWST